MKTSRNDEEEFFRETTAKFLTEFVPPARLRTLRDDLVGFDRDYWRKGAELGWTALLVSEAAGGGSITGNGLADLTLVAHEFGTHAAPGPLVSSAIVAGALSGAGGHEDALGSILAGTAIASWGVAEGLPFAEFGRLGVTIDSDGDNIVINGTKRAVESGGVADYVLVTGRAGAGVSQALVPVNTPGVAVTAMHSVDLTRRFSAVAFDNVRMSSSALVGEAGAAAAAFERQLNQALVLSTAESVGAMQQAFDITVEWAFDRYSFGRPLASYQALKHRYADMKAWLEASHAIVDEAALAVGSGAVHGGELASAAKSFAGQYGSELLQDCVQLHGGLGVTYEHDIHLFLRRHTLNRSLFGTPAQHNVRLGAIARDNEAAA